MGRRGGLYYVVGALLLTVALPEVLLSISQFFSAVINFMYLSKSSSELTWLQENIKSGVTFLTELPRFILNLMLCILGVSMLISDKVEPYEVESDTNDMKLLQRRGKLIDSIKLSENEGQAEEFVRQILSEFGVNALGRDGETLLMILIERSFNGLVKHVVASAAASPLDLNATNDKGMNALMLAVSMGNAEAVDILLRYPAIDPNQGNKKNSNWNAFDYALAKNNLAIINKLINKGAHPNTVSGYHQLLFVQHLQMSSRTLGAAQAAPWSHLPPSPTAPIPISSFTGANTADGSQSTKGRGVGS